MRFFTGLHQPSDARHFELSCISVNRLRHRKSDFRVGKWIMDSGAFTELNLHGRYVSTAAEYAAEIDRWYMCGQLLAAVAQDYMCEPFVVAKTGLSVRRHQELTIDRFDELLSLIPQAYIMPVLQGYEPREYLEHIRMYGKRLRNHDWVGVGSVCKRNSNVGSILDVLSPIHDVRPDLMLHGFGLKTTALSHPVVRRLLFSADSMAWSFAARREGRNANCWREAKRFTERIMSRPTQRTLW